MLNKYETINIEAKWIKFFKTPYLFSIQNSSKKKYTISMPPPNATGILHNGHAFFLTIQDILIRINRLKGFNTSWIPGIDHAGIATQNIIEQLLLQEQRSKATLGRDLFIKTTYNWVSEKTSIILAQMKGIGVSANWDLIRFTLDHPYSYAVNHAFIELWNNDLIYRSERLINWDPVSQTAISDEEVSHTPQRGTLHLIAYKILNSAEEIIIATTRPETIPGDTAIAIHPENMKFSHLIGKQAIHPLFPHRLLPIISDHTVEPHFGSGAIKVTPAHDPLDYLLAKKHNLTKIEIFSKNITLNSNCYEYEGLSQNQAKDAILQKLKSLNLLRENLTINQNMRTSSRSGAPIEYLPSKQFFVKTQQLAQSAIKTIHSNGIKILPARWIKTFNYFMNNIQDWCISRQLWWGHRIPIFYDLRKLNGKNINDIENKQIKSVSITSHINLEKTYNYFKQENDVLDTWFSSALWPMANVGWPSNQTQVAQFYPNSIMETGSDILFFWVARMIMFGKYFSHMPPFKTVFLHNLIRDSQGKKISKSAGNAVDPFDIITGSTLQDLQSKLKKNIINKQLLSKISKNYTKDFPNGIESCGTDGLRLGLILCNKGSQLRLDIKQISKHKTFLNKIWNAARFVLNNMHFNHIYPLHKIYNQLKTEDKFLLSKMQHCIIKVNINISKFKFSQAISNFQSFFLHEFCDWYIEIAKLNKDNILTQNILYIVLTTSIKILHPFCPIITEEIWRALPTAPLCCSTSTFPQSNKKYINQNAEMQFESIKNLISMIRHTKQTSNIKNQDIETVNIFANNIQILNTTNLFHSIIKHLCNLSNININLPPARSSSNSISNSNNEFSIEIILSKSSNKEEKKQLEKKIDSINKKIQILLAKLNNINFLNNAPPAVVNKVRSEYEDLSNLNNVLLKRFLEKNAPRDGFEPPT